MVYGIDLGKKLLSVPGLPVVEPEIKVYPQFLFPDAALREFTEHGNHLATLAIGVAGQDLNQVSESSRSITIDDGENVGRGHRRVDGIKLPHGAVDIPANSIVCGVVARSTGNGAGRHLRQLLIQPFILLSRFHFAVEGEFTAREDAKVDRKSTRLNSSHLGISYAV